MKISRPAVDSTLIHRSYHFSRQEMAECLIAARERPATLSLLISHAITTATCGSAVAPDSNDVRDALKVAAEAVAAVFALASKPDGPITVSLGGVPVTYATRDSDNSCATVYEWLKGFFLASLVRDRKSLDLLFATPVEVLRSSGTTNPEYRFIVAEALKMWRRNESGVAQKFIEVMQATDPARPDIINEAYTLNLDVPAFQCLFYVLSEDADFADALVRAAQLHKKFWTAGKRKREDWDGFLSIPLLGIAALAHDRKLPFELDCDYIPMHLVRGSE